MICRECEVRLAEGDLSGAVAEHLRDCAECRALAGELSENAAALSAMRIEQMPPMPRVRPARAARAGYVRAAAIAAALVIAIVLPKMVQPRVEPSKSAPQFTPALVPALAPAPEIERPVVPAAVVPQPVVHRTRGKPRSQKSAEPLMVKMLTQDPEVVVYWIVDSREVAE